MSDRSNEVLSYWHSLRHGRTAPLRHDLQPSALKHRLPDLFMLGWTNTDLRFRLAGTRICELFDTELRDSNYLGLFRPGSRDGIMDAALSAIRNEEAVQIDNVVEYGSEFLGYEMLLMPLRSPNGICDRLFGSLVNLHNKKVPRPFEQGCFIFRGWLPCQTKDLVKTTPVDEMLRARILNRAVKPLATPRSFPLV